MKILGFVLTLVLSFAFVTVCLAMGKVDTQDAETVQEVIQDSEAKVVAEAYSEPEDVELVEESTETVTESIEESMTEDAESIEESIAADMESMEEMVSVEDVATEAMPNVEEAIAEADELSTTEEKISLLLERANAFVSTEQFQEAVDIAQYILDSLDADSPEAQDLLSMAQAKLMEVAEDTVEDMDDVTKSMVEKVEALGQ